MMRNKAAYLTEPAQPQVRRRGGGKGRFSVPFSKLAGFFMLALIAFPAIAAVLTGMNSEGTTMAPSQENVLNDGTGGVVTADASVSQDFPQFFLCEVAPSLAVDPVMVVRPDIYLALQESPRLYQWANTDDIPFYLQSKSAITGGHNQVDSYLPNRILNLGSGPDFGEVNDWVVDNVDPFAEELDDYEEFDSAVAVSPYDRFGLSGLNWSSYGGEWKYYQVDACAPGEEANDPGLNKFYDERLEPRATFEGTGDSPDPRTQQFNIGWFNKVWYGVTNTVANHIFFVAKLIVSVTIAMISFAFGDIVSLLGLNNILLGEGGDGSGGIFGMLYVGIFQPFVVAAFILTAIYMIWHGIIKRQYRTALVSGLLRSVICFIAAFVIMANASSFVSLPNNIAVFTQSLVFSAFSEGTAGGEGLCSTSIHELTGMPSSPGINTIDPDRSYTYMEGVGASLSSSLGCTMWHTLLLNPWAEGQFGAPVSELYAEGFAPSGGGSIGNTASPNSNDDNGSWVGNADVPLGNDEYINNWAMFQISTQTDSHYDPTTEELSEFYTAGVSNDWWRVVDALSNYNERTFTSDLESVGSTTGDASVEFPDATISDVNLDEFEGIEVEGNDATEYWNSWIGNNAGQRFLMASTSVVFSIASAVPLLILAMLTAMYAIGLSIIVALAPLFLLFACWAGRGWSIFLDWAQLLLNTMLARIAIGVLLVMVMGITVAALNLLDDLGFFRAMVAMIVLSWLVIKNKDKLMEQIAFVRFSSAEGGLSNVASRIGRTGIMASKLGATASLAGATGTVHGAMRGGAGSAFTGMKAGVSTSLKNSMYGRQLKHMPIVRSTVSEYDIAKLQIRGHNEAAVHGVETDMECARCGRKIDPTKERIAKSVKTSLIYCSMCNDSQDFLKGDTRADVREVAPVTPKPAREKTEGGSKLRRRMMTSSQRERYDAEQEAKQARKQAQERLNRGPRFRDGNLSASPDNTRRRIDNHLDTQGGSSYEDQDLSNLVSDMDLDLNSDQDRDFAVAMFGTEDSLKDIKSIRDDEIKARQQLAEGGFSEERLNRHSLDIPKMPDELKGRIDHQVVHELIAEGEWEILATMIAEAWVEWYEEQGTISADSRYETGYDADRISDLRVDALGRVNEFSQNIRDTYDPEIPEDYRGEERY